MTLAVWRIAADTSAYTADDRTGAGANATGGRWNRKGTALIYAASSIALACLETVVHFKASGLPLNRYLVRFDVPDDVWAAAETFDLALHVGWDARPAGMVSLDFGDAWAAQQRSALIRVPSVIVPEEHNILLNPAHPDFARVSSAKLRRFDYDTRIQGAAP
jgi:RES domain-containing protein